MRKDTTMEITIAYQGMSGSNNQQATLEFVQELNLKNVNYIEGISSQGVVDALMKKQARYGVVATYNNLVGDVGETVLALNGISIHTISSRKLHIHHALFTKDVHCEIKTIASHPHALGQCAHHIKRKFPNVKQVEISDTAIGAKHLHTGKLSNDTAVLCRQNAGEYYGLYMHAANVADNIDNFTTFILFELADISLT